MKLSPSNHKSKILKTVLGHIWLIDKKKKKKKAEGTILYTKNFRGEVNYDSQGAFCNSIDSTGFNPGVEPYCQLLYVYITTSKCFQCLQHKTYFEISVTYQLIGCDQILQFRESRSSKYSDEWWVTWVYFRKVLRNDRLTLLAKSPTMCGVWYKKNEMFWQKVFIGVT